LLFFVFKNSFTGESLFGDAMVEEVKKLEEKGLLEENEGAKVVNLKVNSHVDNILIKKNRQKN
jgi:arginyl-tRNA synthetase